MQVRAFFASSFCRRHASPALLGPLSLCSGRVAMSSQSRLVPAPNLSLPPATVAVALLQRSCFLRLVLAAVGNRAARYMLVAVFVVVGFFVAAIVATQITFVSEKHKLVQEEKAHEVMEVVLEKRFLEVSFFVVVVAA